MNGRTKLDKTDRRLLLALDRNARASYAELSKKLKKPEETIRYRVKVLRRDGVISGFMTVVDAGKLGLSYFKVLLKLHNVNQLRVDSITNYLLKEDAVNWVARMDGDYDVGFTVRVANLHELSVFIDALREKFHQFIHRLTLAVNIQVDFFAREYLCGVKRQTFSDVSYFASAKTVKIDQLDYSILRALSDNPRSAASEIAAALRISPQTVLLRISALERLKVIKGYRVHLNSDAIGVLNYYVLLYLNLISKDRQAQFVRYCRSHPNITYFIKALGEWDYELNIEVEKIEEYRALMMELTREFWDIIRDYSSMAVSVVEKLTLTP